MPERAKSSHLERQSGDGEGDLMATFRVQVHSATETMLAAAQAEPDRIWNPRELHALTGMPGTANMTALCDLCNPEYDGRLALTNDLKVRLAP